MLSAKKKECFDGKENLDVGQSAWGFISPREVKFQIFFIVGGLNPAVIS